MTATPAAAARPDIARELQHRAGVLHRHMLIATDCAAAALDFFDGLAQRYSSVMNQGFLVAVALALTQAACVMGYVLMRENDQLYNASLLASALLLVWLLCWYARRPHARQRLALEVARQCNHALRELQHARDSRAQGDIAAAAAASDRATTWLLSAHERSAAGGARSVCALLGTWCEERGAVRFETQFDALQEAPAAAGSAT